MKIAFFSYEYPPETGGGGIGTYLAQMVLHLPKYGHFPVVFCATGKQEAFWENENVYRIPATDYETYNRNLPEYFSLIDDSLHFDIAEGTDFRACGIEVMRQFPNLPFVVRAHTANYLIDQFLYHPLSFFAKLKFIIGGLKRLQIPQLPKPPQEKDFLIEKEFLQACDLVLSPSKSLGEIYKKIGWCSNFTYLPYLFEPSKQVLSIETLVDIQKDIKVIFYGRLEIRKGVLEIAKAIPTLLKKYPTLQFYFYGKSANSPISGIDMQTYLVQKLKKYTKNVFFKGAFKPEDISTVLQQGDIFLFPSRYDNAPLACFEAMSAGKAVIGSSSGGMAEIIESEVSGFLVNPKNHFQIIKQVSRLIENSGLIASFGKKARERIISIYNSNCIIPSQIEIYQALIENSKEL